MKPKILSPLFVLLFISLSAKADIVNLLDLNKPTTETASSILIFGTEHSLYVTPNGIDTAPSSSSLQITAHAANFQLSGKLIKPAQVTLGAGFTAAQRNDVADLNLQFSEKPFSVVTTMKMNSTVSDSSYYTAFRIDAGNNNYNYGWAELAATAEIGTQNLFGAPLSASESTFSIKAIAYNDVVNEGIIVGRLAPAIPEPAVASFMIVFGTAILAGRRIFIKS